jgi:hypothetical protein
MTVGTPRYVKTSAGVVALAPCAVVTITFTVPVPAGLLAVMVFAFTTATEVAFAVPNSTVAPLTKFVPVMVTDVPAVSLPSLGVTADTVGVGGIVRQSAALVEPVASVCVPVGQGIGADAPSVST